MQVRRVLAAIAAAMLFLAAPVSLEAARGLVESQPAAAIDPGPLQPRTLAAGASAVIVGVLLLLYAYRRRLYILYWIGGWSCFGASMYAAGRTFASPYLSNVTYGGSQLLAICSALFFIVAADAYGAAPRFRKRHATLLLPIAIWFLLAPLALGSEAVFAPGHLLTGTALTVAGAAHLLILRRARLFGAGFVGAMLLLSAAINVWIAVRAGDGTGGVLSDAFLVAIALYFVSAFGMQLMTFEDMTYELRRANGRLERAQSELRQLVVTDALTGCRNRRFFDEVIAHELNSHRRYAMPLSLMFVDVDRFKIINDTLGHAAGDRVLREVGAFLVSNTRNADYVFRWGGDEFLLLLSCREEEAVNRGYELQREFAGSPAAAGLPRGVGLSFGCAEVSGKAETVADALKVADERMYMNKRSVRLPQERAV